MKGAALAFGLVPYLAALRNRGQPMIYLRKLLYLGAALAFGSGLAALRNREETNGFFP